MGEQLDGAASLAAALQAQLTGLELPLSVATQAALYKNVCDCVDGMRALGWPPERVIVTVKRVARDAGLQPSSRSVLTEVHLTGVDRVLVDMVGWCIERYYHQPDQDGEPRRALPLP